jgi:AraC family transcriptional regulator
MAERPNSVFRTAGEVILTGRMAVYDSQAEASLGIPQQWRSFLMQNPALKNSSKLYGASPSSDDRKIHYLAGVAEADAGSIVGGESVVLLAGEYAVVRVDDTALLRDTWAWLLRSWLPNSGRREKNAPEFERFTSIPDDGNPVGPVEIWIPLEPLESAV